MTGPLASEPIVVFAKGDLDYHTFRIPALLEGGGRVYAFAEGRRSSAHDSGEIDILVSVSDDLGQSWSSPEVVCHVPGLTCGNPTPVWLADARSPGLLYCTNQARETEQDIIAGLSAYGRKVWWRRLDRDGKAISEPTEISARAIGPGVTWTASGPGGAVVLQGGRIACPLNVVVAGQGVADGGIAHVLYSDDGGGVWRLGAAAVPNGGNESHLVNLGSRGLLLLARFHGEGGPPHRTALSRDGGETWTPVEPVSPADALLCKASAIRDDDVVLMLVPTGLRKRGSGLPKRINLTLFSTDDLGATWRHLSVIDSQFAAYSDMVRLPDGAILALWEHGDTRAYQSIVAAKLTTDPAAEPQPAS